MNEVLLIFKWNKKTNFFHKFSKIFNTNSIYNNNFIILTLYKIFLKKFRKLYLEYNHRKKIMFFGIIRLKKFIILDLIITSTL